MSRPPQNRTKPTGVELAAGVVFWALFSVLAVALRGVRWDETYEWAQILLGEVIYPEAHPTARYAWSAFTIQHYVTAGVMTLVDDPLVVNGIRNALFLAFGVSAVFLWTARLAGSIAWGSAATALALFGVLTPFETTYPLRLWPFCFSNGPIGTGWAIITLILVLTQRWRSGLFMLAAMPVIHIGQAPAVLLICLLFTAVQWRYGAQSAVKRALPFALMGLALCIGLASVIYANRMPAPESGPYASDADAMTIWSKYKEVWYHMTIRGGLNAFLHSHIAAVMAILLPMPWAWRAVKERRFDDIWLWLCGFAIVTAGAVWTALWLHTRLGPDVPFIVIRWMPYRIANHLPFLVLAIAIGIHAREPHSRVIGFGILALGLIVSMLGPLLPRALGDDTYQRYIADGSWIVFLLVGSAAGTLAHGLRPDGPVPAAWGALVLAALFVLIPLHQFGAALLVGGAIANWLVARAFRAPALEMRSPLYALAAIAIVTIAAREYVNRDEPPEKGFDVKLEVSPFDRAVREYFAERGISNELIVADNFAAFMQARLNQPVMANWMIGSYTIYVPPLAPRVQKIMRDVYGIAFGESLDGRLPKQPDVWQPFWASRSTEEWQRLAAEYDVRYVIAPASLDLDLPQILARDGHALYRIPDSTPR